MIETHARTVDTFGDFFWSLAMEGQVVSFVWLLVALAAIASWS